MPYLNRSAAGKILAESLQKFRHTQAVVLALPRGGVPVAYEIAKTLKLKLDVFLVRKLGVPSQPELAFGAMAMNNVIELNQRIVKEFHLSKDEMDEVMNAEKLILEKRYQLYRHGKSFADLTNKEIILVDDGIATGATMRVAILALRSYHPKHITVSVPVASQLACEELEMLADEIICPLQPAYFNAVGEWYDDFTQVSDEAVIKQLKE